MSINLEFDSDNNPITPSFVLANHSGNRLGLLHNVSAIDITQSLMDCPTVTFTVTKGDGDDVEPLWDSITDIKLVHCVEYDEWSQIQVEINETDDSTKTVYGRGLCQSELSQTLLHGLEFNTEDDIESDDYVRRTIYNFENPSASVLHSIFDKIPHYKLKHVDKTIASLQKTLSFDGVSVVDALNTICEECHAVVIYNNGTNEETNMPAREVSIYDLEQNCNSCGHRGEFTDVCPECGSEDIDYGYGEDTTIFITRDNLTDNIKYTTDLDSVKNCFKLVGGDDTMTAAIRMCNPNGTDYIWYISDELLEDMPQELSEKIGTYNDLYNYYLADHVTTLDSSLVDAYNALVNKYSRYNPDLKTIDNLNVTGFPALMSKIYDVIDFKSFLEHGLMPIDEEVTETTAVLEASKLTSESLSPIALNKVNEYSKEIIDQMVLNVARIIVDNRYDVSIKTSELFLNDDEDESRKHRWVGTFTVKSFADETKTADSGVVQIFINKDYERYIRQRVNLILSQDDEDEFKSIDLLDIDKTEEDFRAGIAPYNKEILLGLKDTCDTCLDAFQAESLGNKDLWEDMAETLGVDLYDKYYLNYYTKLEILLQEIENKEREIEVITNLGDYIYEKRDEIQDTLNFENYIGSDLWYIFCSYRREDIYQNENYISDGLNNEEIFDNALEFYETAQKEIYKSATMQHSISSSLKNLLTIKEFSPLLEHFKLGNWLRIEIDGEIYRLRLIQYSINYDNLEELSVEFSDVTKTVNGLTDIESLLSKTKSMATSYGGVKRQATKGIESYETLSDWFTDGLDATLTKILDSGETQNVVIDNHGILLRNYDEVTDSYYQTQMKFINSVLAITDDNWRTIKTAVGNFIYRDPITNEYISAYGVNAETVVGNLILGSKLRLHNDAANMIFDENGLWIYNDTNGFRVNPNSDTLLQLTKNDEKIFWVDENGMLHISGDGAGLDISLNDSISGLESQLTITAQELRTEYTDGINGFSSELSQTASEIRTELADRASGLESQITQTADSITSSINDYRSGLESSIKQTAESLGIEISDDADGLADVIDITVNGISGIVEDRYNGLYTIFEETANGITMIAGDEEEKEFDTVTIEAHNFLVNLNDLYEGVNSSISQTANQIRLEVDDKYSGVTASINTIIEDDIPNIRSEITTVEGNISSIDQKYDAITSEVRQEMEEDRALYTDITQTIDLITSEVFDTTDPDVETVSRIDQSLNQIGTLLSRFEDMEENVSSEFVQTREDFRAQINSLIINGRNFAYQTSDLWNEARITSSDEDPITLYEYNIGFKDKGLINGDTCLVHFDIRFSSNFAKRDSSATASLIIRINTRPNSSIPNYIYTNASLLTPILNTADKEGHVSFSVNITNQVIGSAVPPVAELTITSTNYVGTVWVKNLMVEAGEEESGWISAPEDINANFYDVQTYVRQNKSDIQLLATRADGQQAMIDVNADKISLLVEDGESGTGSEFTITDEAAELIASKINLSGLVSITGLDQNAQRAIVKSVIPLYMLGDSNTEAPAEKDNENWSAEIDWESVEDYFVWQLMETTYGDSTKSRTEPQCISDSSDNSRTIANVTTYYGVSTSSTKVPTNFSVNLPSNISANHYIWTKRYIEYTDGTGNFTEPELNNGLNAISTIAQDVTSTYLSTGYHKVIYSESAPAAPHVEGDVWHCTSGSRVTGIYVWQNGAWVEQTHNATVITNGTITTDLIAANAITTAKLATDVLKSANYVGGTDGKYSEDGTYIDLTTGQIYTPNFAVTANGNAYFNGYVRASSGSIGGWSLSETAIYGYTTIDETQYLCRFGTPTDASGSVFSAGNGNFYVRANGTASINTATIGSLTITGGLYDANGNIIYENQGSSSNLSTRVSTLESNVVTINNTTIPALETRIAAIENAGYSTQINNLSSRVTALENSSGGGSGGGSSTDYSSQINSLDSRVTTLETAVTALEDASTKPTALYSPNEVMTVQINTAGNVFMPSRDDAVFLGYTTYRWKQIYAMSGTILTSDERQKNMLSTFDDRHKNLFMSIDPIVFKWKSDGESNAKYHWGISAQEFERAANNVGLSNELAALDYDNENDIYGMVYTEAQMLSWYVTQQNTNDIDAMKKENARLLDRIAALENALNKVLDGDIERKEMNES